MSHRTITVGIYVFVLFILAGLTLLTVAVSFVPLPPHWHLTAGVSIGVMKASLVVLFFMHAAFSPRITWCVITAAVFWVVVLFSLSMTDYATRLSIPFVPGH